MKEEKRQDYNHNDLTGVDVDIEISLKEYGFAWIETETEYLFYYGITMEKTECLDYEYTKFDFSVIDKSINILEEYDWAEWESIYSYTGLTKTEFHEMPLYDKIHDLLLYYGYDDVFGSSYWEGLSYDEVVKGI